MNDKFLSPMLKVVFILTAVFCSDCRAKNEFPGVPDDQLARITADLFVVEAATANLSGKTKDSLYQAYAAQVFELHGIDKDLYEKNLLEVAKDLGRMEKMSITVENLLKTEKEEGSGQ